jgi:hypothetical protein
MQHLVLNALFNDEDNGIKWCVLPTTCEVANRLLVFRTVGRRGDLATRPRHLSKLRKERVTFDLTQQVERRDQASVSPGSE